MAAAAASALSGNGKDSSSRSEAGRSSPALVSWVSVGRSASRLATVSMRPLRADVIAAGALILERVLRRTTVDELVASQADILDGIAWSIA